MSLSETVQNWLTSVAQLQVNMSISYILWINHCCSEQQKTDFINPIRLFSVQSQDVELHRSRHWEVTDKNFFSSNIYFFVQNLRRRSRALSKANIKNDLRRNSRTPSRGDIFRVENENKVMRKTIWTDWLLYTAFLNPNGEVGRDDSALPYYFGFLGFFGWF